MILAGDIGGTNSRLAIFEATPGGLALRWRRTSPSREHDGLRGLVASAVAEADLEITAATFGVAGPVENGRTAPTNLPWHVDARELADVLQLDQVGLVNDLEANAWGLSELADEDLLTLHGGVPGAPGNAAMIAAGTGLGEAGLFWDGKRRRPFACEGGHASFAPTDELEDELLRFLRARHGHVSWERVLSGPGLHALYEFLRERARAREPAWLTEALAEDDPAAVISKAASDGKDEVCVGALERFVRLYGAEAGNLALEILATGGVYVGGGIAPKIAAWLERPLFVDAFLAKGRMRPLLEKVSVRVILNEDTALLGAARHAAEHAG